jgi:hypothetical protein
MRAVVAVKDILAVSVILAVEDMLAAVVMWAARVRKVPRGARAREVIQDQ